MPNHQSSTPLIPGFSPDPSICRAGEDYFLALSSFDYFPGVPLYHSKDIRHWRQIGHALNRPAQLPLQGAESSAGIFAPTLRHHDGWFYLITTNTTHGGNFIVKTRDPYGEWSDPLWLPDVKGIDPDLFWDTDGTAYLHWSIAGVPNETTGIRQARFNPQDGRLLETPRLIWEGTGGTYPEGPHMFQRGNWYYLCIAEGGTDWGHMQTIARSSNIQGPWSPGPHNPILTHRSIQNPIQCVGHADLVQTPNGEWFGVCHGVQHLNYPSYHILGRETHLFPVRWTEDDWPVFADNSVLRRDMPIIPGARYQPIDTAFEDTFNDDVFPLEWAWLRNPDMSRYQCRDGCLQLQGSTDILTSTKQPTWIGVRQRDHAFQLEAHVTDTQLQDGSEAGLVVYPSNDFHAVIGIRREGSQHHLFTRQRLGQVVQDTPGPALPTTPFSWIIQGDPKHYHLGWKDAQGRLEILCEADAKMYSVEVAGKFTGAMLGMYVQGEGHIRCDRFSRQPVTST